MVNQPQIRRPDYRNLVYFNGSAIRGTTAEPIEVTAWRKATDAAARCMEHTCAELARIPLRPDSQQQVQSLKRANKRLEAELEEAKANSQLKRYKALQSDLKEADRVKEALRSVLCNRAGMSDKEVDGVIDFKVLKAERAEGASRELLQRELRQLRALQSSGLITSQTHQPPGSGSLELCKAPRPAHKQELSAYSQLIGDIEEMVERLLLTSHNVSWEIPLPPQTSEAAAQTEGLDPTPAEQLAEELARMRDIVGELRGTHSKVAEKINEATGIMDQDLSEQERRVAMKTGLAAAIRRAEESEARAERSAQQEDRLRDEAQRLREVVEKQANELSLVKTKLAERERVVSELQQRLVEEMQQLKEVQVNTARDTMQIITTHHTKQASAISDTRSLAKEAAELVEKQSDRIQTLAVVQKENADVSGRVLKQFTEEASELRRQINRLEHDNRNITHKLAAQTALVGHVRRLDREAVDQLGVKVAGKLGAVLPGKLNAKQTTRDHGSSPEEKDARGAGRGGPGLWAYAVASSNASTATEDAEPASVVASGRWRAGTAGVDYDTAWGRREAPLPKGRSSQRLSFPYDEDEPIAAWESLEELRPMDIAPGAKIYPESHGQTVQQRRFEPEKVATWLHSTYRSRAHGGKPAEGTEDLLAESRALRCELTCLLNAAKAL